VALTIAVSDPDDHGHVWSAERCERCWCEPSWPLAKQPCPFRKAKSGENGAWDVEDDDGPTQRRRESTSEEARARAREKQRERRSKMDPEAVRAQNRIYKQRQRQRERDGRSARRSQQQDRAA
jgi:hypothetical protein